MSIVVVGAGPAGLAAACAAGKSGAAVTLIDDNPQPGGQIWRMHAGAWPQRLSNANVELRMGARVIDATDHELRLETTHGSPSIRYGKLIIATGSRELFLPFPGWTLPGVLGAGGLQALVKSGLPVHGKRVVVAGTGPLLLAVAAHLGKLGADVLTVAEQASWTSLLGFGALLPWRKRLEAVNLWNRRYSPGTWVQSAAGDRKLETVMLCTRDQSRSVACDYLAVGYGLVPNTELAKLLGFDPSRTDDDQCTDVANIYGAGEVTGVGGADLSLAEGAIAGYAAAGNFKEARKHFAARAKWRHFAKRMNAAFALRPELKGLPQPDTLVCRCEDVSMSQLTGFNNWREAKLQTRCGMGPCQGRICGPALQFLRGWQPDSVRPPIFPARLSSLLTEE